MPKILVIEDDASILTGLRDALQQEEYEVLTARNGKQGLDFGLRENADLIILDIMLPGIDGYEICRKLREDNIAIPILMLTARSREADKVVGLELGADDYITKPFGVSELLARVKALLRRMQRLEPHKPSTATIGEVTIDFDRYRAQRKGKPLNLTAREFAILAYFVRHKGKLVTRDDLLTALWGYDDPPETRTVDVHLAKLRKKIEKNPSRPQHLVSIRGAGYRLEG